MQNSPDLSEQNLHEISSDDSSIAIISITPTTSEVPSFKAPEFHTKSLATKTMIKEAIKASSTKSRKGFSLAQIRKYISQKYLLTTDEVKRRIPFVKKFFKTALETGDVVSVKGVGLTGSFRIPPTSPLHKNAKSNSMKIKARSKVIKKTLKKLKPQNRPAAKPKKLKKPQRSFSASA